MDIQKFFDTLFYLYGKENSVKVKYSLERIK
jgi:hypothetical protein